METYSLLRQFADSWMLLFLFVFFIGVIVWAFRPGSRRKHDDSADIPFRHEDAPAPPRAGRPDAADADDADDKEARK